MALALAGSAAPAFADGPLDYSANLFGDLGGIRSAFAKVGGTINLTESSEVFANPVGGAKQGANYDGLTTLSIQVDTKPGLKIDGGLFNVSFLQLHGENYSVDNIRALQTISGIEGDRATRLWELWYQQKFGDHFDVKIGEQSLDVEFMNHPSAGYFINSTFGWPTLAALDLPGGGPAFPLSSPGVRAKIYSGQWTGLVGVFSGEPAPMTNPDPQHANPYGLSFPLLGFLAIAEAQYAVGSGDKDLTGVYKIGAWYDSLNFADQRYNALGQPLGNPAFNQIPRQDRGDFSIYAVAEQMVWRDPGEKDHTLSLFIRPIIAPQSDRNLSVFSIDGGLALHEPLPGRKDDTFAAGFGIQELGAGAVGFTGDSALYTPGVYTAPRSYEAVFETSYQAQLTPWMNVQPSVQYVRNPGGGLANPYQPNQKIRDALVFGLRGNITF